MHSFARICASVLSFSVSTGFAQSIAEINGIRFLSPYRNQVVNNVTGLVTATGPDGFWLRSTEPDDDDLTSESIYVFSSGNVTATVGNIITLNGRVSEYRSSSAYLFLTEVISPVVVEVVSSGNDVEPLVIGNDLPYPPTKQYTFLDDDDVFSIPNNESLVSVENPILSPSEFGLDYWESLSGELVTVKAPVAISKPNNFGDTWVRGSRWRTSNLNGRGGLTLAAADANPEAIIIGSPLDGSDNPNGTKLGDGLADITGVITYAFGFYRILPLTAISITAPKTPPPSPASLTSSDTCSGFVMGSYNVENLSPSAPNLPLIADHIASYLHSPPLLFLQEIQDDNGETNDAVVSANLTLSTLASTIASLGGPEYEFIDIVPVDDQDGGAPGGNIRVAYMYNPDIVELVNPNPGSSTDAVEVTESSSSPGLNFNPGRIEPFNAAWNASRKPLVAQWRFVEQRTSTANSTSSANTTTAASGGKKQSTFFTINVHLTSKGGSSSLHGDPRPPVNGGVDQRLSQTQLIADFVNSIFEIDEHAKLIIAGDFNEFSFVEPLEQLVDETGLKEVDVVAKIPRNERYTYLFDMNSQQLDHGFVSPSVAGKGVQVEHVHVNTWVASGEEASDHDPTVVGLNLC